MGNDVQLHESVVERAPGEERRASPRHDASSLGAVNARIIGGSPVELVNFSARGVLFECDSRLLIGARASVRITTTDANLIVTGRVVRSRVKGLVNGALRYDAALALDSELALQPAYVAPVVADVAPAPADELDEESPLEVAFESDEVAFESEAGIDGVFDPAPVEAYLAESDAALAEVASVVEPPPVPVSEPEADAGAANEPFHVNVTVGLEPIAAVDSSQSLDPVSVEPEVEAVALIAEAPAVIADEPMTGEPMADEPVAFEADAEIAFEASSDFEFEAMPADDVAFAPEPIAAAESLEAAEPVASAGEPLVADTPLDGTAEPAGASMFDATYRPPAEDVVVASAPMFEVTPPMPVHQTTASSMFDARPSEQYGDGAPEEAAVAELVPAAPAVGVIEAAASTEPEAIDFETEVAFEAADTVMFETAFEADGAAADAVEYAAAPEAPGATESPVTRAAAEMPPPVPEAVAEAVESAVAAPEAMEPIEVIEPVEEGLDALADVPLPAAAADDRVLLQFSASVPHDLAELRRIAADNQW